MGAAEVIAFEEGRARKQWDTRRHQLHERFAQGLDTLAPQWHEPPATFPEMTATGWDVRQQLPGGITEARVAPVPRGEPDRTQGNCPRCDGVVRAQALGCRTVETLGGPVRLERPYCYCRRCRVGCSPCDDALGVVAGCTQLDVPQAVGPLVTAVPYDTAPALFGDLTGMACGSDRMPTVPNQVGEQLTVVAVAPAREASLRRIASVAAGRLRRPVLGLGLDGAEVPTRPDRARDPQEGRRHTRAKRARWRGQGRDATGVRFARLDGARSVHGRRWPQGPSDEPLGAALTPSKAAGLMPADQVRRCVVCDGAEWRGQPVQARLPQARQGRDSYHWAPYRHRVAKAH
jgi:hypothetical protein